jgi:hypothetical protein
MTIVQNSTYILEILVTDLSGSPVTGLSVNYAIYNSSSNSLITSGSLTDSGNGIYKTSYLFNTLGQFRVIYTTPSGYTDEIETVVVVADTLSAIKSETDKIKFILGLTQSNMVITNQIYDSDNNLISATIRIYPTASDANSNTNILATYSMTATYTAGLLTNYKVIQT